MKIFITAMIMMFLSLADDSVAQERVGSSQTAFFLPQGYLSPWLSSRGPSGSSLATDDFAGSENPAALVLHSYPTALLGLQYQTDIKRGWLLDIPVNGYQSWEPAQLSVVVPFDWLSIGVCYYQDYFGELDFGRETFEDEQGQTKTVNFIQTDQIRTAGLSLASQMPFKLPGFSLVSGGIRIQHHWLQQLFNFPEVSGKGTAWSWSAGLLVETEQVGTVGFFYNNQPESDLLYKGNEIIREEGGDKKFVPVSYKMIVEVPDELMITYGYRTPFDIVIETSASIQYWDRIYKNLKGGYEYSFFIASMHFTSVRPVVGVWFKKRNYTEKYQKSASRLFKEGDLDAVLGSIGLSFPIGPVILDGVWVGDTGFSGKYQKQHTFRLNCAYLFKVW
ncbi:MAG: hypothetical protein HUU10_12600 [Bacteroidetes bacterium]|nr:hypothetical protein [Bacteroidota bacterium]